jgi:hypothetical protein
MATPWIAPPVIGRRVHLVAFSLGLQAVLIASLVAADLALDSAYGSLTVGTNPVLLILAGLLVPATAVTAVKMAAGRPAAYRPAIYLELAWLVTSVLLMRSGSLAAPGLLVLSLALLTCLFGQPLRRELRILRGAESGEDNRLIAGPRQVSVEGGPWLPRRSRRMFR